jgi:hypothetical protein
MNEKVSMKVSHFLILKKKINVDVEKALEFEILDIQKCLAYTCI